MTRMPDPNPSERLSGVSFLRLREVRLYLRLRRAYKRNGVLPYSRLKTWDDVCFAERMRRL